MTTLCSCTVVKHTIFRHNKTDEKEIDDVEEADTPNNLPGRFRDFFLGVFGLGGSQSSKFGSPKGK